MAYTYLPAASRLLFLWTLILYRFYCLHNARNTMKILPIEASYLSHALQVFHIPDMYNLPILQFLQAVILLFLSAHRNLRPEA